MVLTGRIRRARRWLVTYGYGRKAEAKVRDIEQRVAQGTRECLQPPKGGLEIRPRKSFGFGLIFGAMFERYRSRGTLALTLMIAQSFLFNAVFFSYGLVLNSFHKVPKGRTAMYLAPLAASSFPGPLLLGRLLDTVGRRTMISGTYAVAGVPTASEIFTLETRALAIAVFYSLGTAIGGTAARILIGTGSQWAPAGGYIFAAGLMLVAALAEASLGVNAEGRSLENIAGPLSAS